MKILIKILFLSLIMCFTASLKAQQKMGLVVHGGAGNITQNNLHPELEKEYRQKIQEALQAGWQVLENKGSSLDAVTVVIQILEESPLFNAGRGSVLTKEGKAELDASIMDGSSGLAGAVAGIKIVKSPILAARAVMEQSPHVMLSGRGAEDFAAAQGLEMVDPSYFLQKGRNDNPQNIQQQDKEKGGPLPKSEYVLNQGTVGAVALDEYGNLAAGTSTGGMSGKQFGRIGDSPIIGAGTYADNNTCAVSATGHGEFFIRNVVAYDISALMKYKNISIEAASNEVITKLQKKGGKGGVIAIDHKGNIAMPFNTEGMFRGFIQEKDRPQVFIFK